MSSTEETQEEQQAEPGVPPARDPPARDPPSGDPLAPDEDITIPDSDFLAAAQAFEQSGREALALAASPQSQPPGSPIQDAPYKLTPEAVASLDAIFKAPVCIYSQDQVDEMRALGLPKPPEVTWGMWMGPKKCSHVHEALIYMAASGATNKRIADDLGYTQSRISIILSKPEIKAKIKAVQQSLWGENADRRFSQLLPSAIDVAEEVLNNPNERSNLRVDVAFRLMDRALGKPKQEVTVEGNLIADLIHKLDQQEAMHRIVPALKSSQEPEHPIDKYIDDNIPADFTVGKRQQESDE